MTNTSTSKNTHAGLDMDLFRASLERAAAKCGVSIEGIAWASITIDRTWGDLCGLVFYGASPEANERAAHYFARWASKRKRGGSYNAQRAIRVEGPAYFARFNNGVEGWHKGTLPAYEPREIALGGGRSFTLERVETREGFCVATTYYPSAD